MAEFSKYIGMDVHKETIAVAVAEANREEPRYLGEIANRPEDVRRLLKRLGDVGKRLRFCYEAGPCGYGLYRQIVAAGHACAVVAPALIPRKPGERVKTDRRDSLSLARLDRSGDLTAVWVPGPEQEAMRDLSRAREDMKTLDKQTRQRLSAFLLRQGRNFAGKQRWTQAHFRWIELQKMDSAVQQIVLEEYVEAVRAGQARTAAPRRFNEGGQRARAADAGGMRLGVSISSAEDGANRASNRARPGGDPSAFMEGAKETLRSFSPINGARQTLDAGCCGDRQGVDGFHLGRGARNAAARRAFGQGLAETETRAGEKERRRPAGESSRLLGSAPSFYGREGRPSRLE